MAAGQRIGRRGRKNHAGLLSYYREREAAPMKGYKHLTAHDRNKMAKMRKEGATMRNYQVGLESLRGEHTSIIHERLCEM